MVFLRLMSFNILNELPEGDIESYSDHWPNRAEFNVKTIRRYEPDIIGFQEFQKIHWESYQNRFPEYVHCIEDPTAPFHSNAIFYRSARFDLLDSGTFWLTRTPHKPDPDWGIEYPLSVHWVLLTMKENDAPLLFLNTQYEDGPWGEEMRVEGTKVLLQQIEVILHQAPGAAVIITGDFNCNAWSEPYKNLLGHGFVDTYRAAGHADSALSSTFHGMRGSGYFALEWGNQTFWRVDWILARAGSLPIQTVSCTIVQDAEPPVYPSDHYPVVTELTVG